MLRKKVFKPLAIALLIVFMFSTVAMAATPNNTIFFGGKAYNLSLLNDPTLASEIAAAFVANGNKFVYKTPAGGYIDANAANVDPSTLPAGTYMDADKTTSDYGAGDTEPSVELAVESVSAINGTITVIMTGEGTPVKSDFSFGYKINGVGSKPFPDVPGLSDPEWNAATKTASFTFTPFAATNEAQSIEICWKYAGKGGWADPFVVEAEALTVSSVSAIADINVDFGTAIEGITFPAKVTLNLSDETTAEVDATFACDTYDGNVAGEYVFTATYELPEGVTGDKPAATVKVVVAEKPMLAVESVSAITTTTIEATLATAKADAVAADFNVTVADAAVAVTAVAANADNTVYTLTVDLAGKEGALKVNGTAAAAAIDFKAPTVVSATAINNTSVNVVFSEKVDKTTAETATNYTVNNGLNVASATLQADGITVKLVTDTQYSVTNYTVTVANVKDLAGNVIATGNTATFAGSEAPVIVKVLANATDITQSAVATLTDASTSITADFNVNIASVTTQTVKLYNVTDGAYVPGTPTVAAGDIVFTPVAGQIAANKTYRLEIASTVQSENGFALGEAYTFTFIVGAAPGAPTLTPANGATGIAVASSITAKFNQEMDAASFTADSIKVEKLDQNSNVAGTVAGTITYEASTRTATFKPAANLEGETQYTVTVLKGIIKNAAGIALQNDATATFTTAAAVNPAVKKVEIYEGAAFAEKTTGATGVKVDGDGGAGVDIKITLDKAIAGATKTADNVLLYNKTTGVYETITVGELVANDNTVTIAYSANLDYGTQYEITLNGLTDTTANENPLPEYKFTFTTETGAPTFVQMFSDVGGAAGSYDAGTDLLVTEGVTNVDETKDLYVEFGATIGAITQNTDVKLYNITDSKYVTLANTTQTTKYIKVGNADLAADKQYKLIVEKTVKDATTNVGLDSKIERTFTTLAAAAKTAADGSGIAVTGADGTSYTLYTVGANKVALDKPVTVTFDKKILASSITADTVKLVKVADGTAVNATRALDAAGTKITITPTTPLAESTNYTVVVTTGLKDFAGNKVTAFNDLTKKFTTVAQVGYTTNIANNATDVAATTKLELQFNKAMATATLTGSSNNGTDNKNIILNTIGADGVTETAVDISAANVVVYDVNTYKVTIDKALAANTTYQLKLDRKDITDAAGNALNSAAVSNTPVEVLRFKTAADTVAPKLVSATVGTGATLKDLNGAKAVAKAAADLKFTFDEAIAAVAAGNITIIDMNTQSAVDLSSATATFATGATTKIITINLNQSGGAGATALADDTNYRMIISGLKDAAGNTAANVEVTFLTGPAPTIADEDSSGTIKTTGGLTNVAVANDNTIVIEDSANEALATVAASNVVFTVAGEVVDLGHTVTMAADGKTVTIKIPKNKLVKGETYKMEVTGVTDLAGNPMANANGKFSMTFSTEPEEGKIFASQVTFEDANGDALADQGQLPKAYKANIDFVFAATVNFTGVSTIGSVTLENLTNGKTVALLQGMITAENGSGTGDVLRITPTPALENGKIYRITIKSGLTDSVGNVLMENIVLTFNVEA